MNPFTRFTSAIVTFIGLGLAIYVGIWVMLVGGIANIIQAFHPFIPGLFTLGVVKLFLCDITATAIFGFGVKLSAWLQKGETNDNPQTS